MPSACIQLHNYDFFEKAQLKLSPLIQNRLTKNVRKLLHQPGVDYSSFPWTFMGNTGDGKKSYPTAKHLLISPIRKTPLNRFKYFAAESFISSPSNSNFQVIILCNLHLKLQSFLLYHVLNFRLYVHTCHANLTNLCLLNVAFSMRKALTDWSSPRQNFCSRHLSISSLPPMLFWKPCFYYCLVSSFSDSLFYFKPFKISTDSTLIGILWFCGLIKYNRFQISGNKSYETPYSMP